MAVGRPLWAKMHTTGSPLLGAAATTTFEQMKITPLDAAPPVTSMIGGLCVCVCTYDVRIPNFKSTHYSTISQITMGPEKGKQIILDFLTFWKELKPEKKT